MAKLKEYNGHYCESEYEYAFLGFLEKENWLYMSGKDIDRERLDDVLISKDLKDFISKTNKELSGVEIDKIYDNVRLVGSDSDFSTLHKVYGWMVNGIQFTPENGLPTMISLMKKER